MGVFKKISLAVLFFFIGMLSLNKNNVYGTTTKDLEILVSEINQPDFKCKKIDNLNWEDSILSFFIDSRGNRFVLKQIKNSSPSEQFLLVLDALGARLAEELDIPHNRIRVLAPNISFSLKEYPDYPAILETFVEGDRTDSNAFRESFKSSVDIHQRYRKEGCELWKRYGPLSSEKRGLTQKVIKQMTKHKDLPIIVGLDTYVGNKDRSKPNIFYNKAEDRFIGIDMGGAFSTPLAKEAIKQIKNLKEKNINIS
jgi:hypothetical protein